MESRKSIKNTTKDCESLYVLEGEQKGKCRAPVVLLLPHSAGQGFNLCEYFCHWREKNQLHLSPNLDLDWDKNELQALVADLSNVTQVTVTSRMVLVSHCREMHCVDSYI